MKQNARYAGAALLAAGGLAVMPVLADKPAGQTEGEEPLKTEAIREADAEALPAESGEATAAAKAGEGEGTTAKTGSTEDPTEDEKTEVAPPKPISEQIRKGLAYLAKIQNADGGWGQGGGWRVNTEGSGRVQGEQAEDRSDVGNTCVAITAMMRSGADLRSGQYAENLRKGVEYLMKTVEANDNDTLYVTHVRDTQLQSKIGRYVDTFLAAQVLSELKGQMLDPESEKRRSELLDKVIAKIEKNQQENGAFAGNAGWASVLSQGLASRAVNGARLAGANVSDQLLERDFAQSADGVDPVTSTISGGAGGVSSAGVSLYTSSSKLRGLQENWVVNQRRKQDFDAVLQSEEASEEEKAKAQGELEKIAVAEEATDVAFQAVQKSVKNENFVKGFGNNGGEEFLSYMNISESLRAKGGKEWTDWDVKICGTINDAQNDDGSWSGHHCITGRTFCTAGALLTLMADRAPLPTKEEAAKEGEDAPGTVSKADAKPAESTAGE